MRQQKALLAIFGVAFVLVAGLVVYGCGRSGDEGEEHEHAPEGSHPSEHMEGGEHMHGEGKHEEGEKPELSGAVENGVRVVQVKARKFEFDPDTIVVRDGEDVRLEITSEDTTHGFGLGDFEIDQKLPPGETQTIEFTADKPGRHHFHCSVYCGAGHDTMHGTLVVLEEGEGMPMEEHEEGEEGGEQAHDHDH